MLDKYSTVLETVDAIQYNGDNKQAILDFAGSKVWTSGDQESTMVKTPMGDKYVLVGDWIVQKPGGQFHIMRDDEFYEIYRPQDQTEADTTELTKVQAKRILEDIRDIRREIELTNMHLIELEKLFMLMFTELKQE